MKCCKCFRKVIEIVVYIAAGYFCGGCSNTGTCVFHTNVLNVNDANSSTNTPSIKE